MATFGAIATGVGTATGAGAVIVGLKKRNLDISLDELRAKYDAISPTNDKATNEEYDLTFDPVKLKADIAAFLNTVTDVNKLAISNKLKNDIAEKDAKSKKLGNIRTGLSAATGVTGVAGAVISATNKVDSDLKTRLKDCRAAIENMDRDAGRAMAESGSDNPSIATARKISAGCLSWKTVDESKINSFSNIGLIAAAIQAATGIAGAVVSSKANSDNVRSVDTKEGKLKEDKLNMTANTVMIGATAAGGVATVFSALQISAVKKALTAADKCEEALK
ncbi:hypothetical protein FACS18945_2370 [Bacteroidia bacterium]|nr:hypothetical protein FACS18945_2370 [Bacteroidia bacterium]